MEEVRDGNSLCSLGKNPPPPLDAKKHLDPDARRDKSYLSQLRREHNVGDPPHPQSLAVASITSAHSGALLTSTMLCQNWISTGCLSPVTVLFCRKAPRMWLFSTELFCSSCKSQGSCGECLKTPGCRRSPKGLPPTPGILHGAGNAWHLGQCAAGKGCSGWLERSPQAPSPHQHRPWLTRKMQGLWM